MSRWHIFPLTLILSLAFTYTGVEESLWMALAHPDFQINLFLNTLEIWGLIYYAYHLHFRKNRSMGQALWRTLLLFYLLQLLRAVIIEYEPEDYTELWSIVIPFGTILIFAFNYFYHLRKQMDQVKQSAVLPEPSHSPLWLETTSGKVQIDPSNILYADLQPNYLELITPDKTFKGFLSLKKLEEELRPYSTFFRLNKQSLCHAQAVQSYRSLKDGRLEVTLSTGEIRVVSKNKASSFKKWIAKDSP